MHSSVWRFEHHVARLRLDRFSAAVDLDRPAQGIVEVCPSNGQPVAAHLLGVAIPSLPARGAGQLTEHFARGTDLVATYNKSGSQRVQVEALWRLVRPTASDKFVAAAELLVSVHTHAFDGQPELIVQSHLSETEPLRLLDAEAAAYQPSVPAPKAPLVVRPEDGPGCLMFRLPGGGLSYGEMVHPADFRHDELARFNEDASTMRVRHRLFCERLEKGVMLRARVRGVFAPRDDDAHIIAESYLAFAAAEPPLEN